MAEGFARMHGRNQVEPYSAGIWPSGRVHTKAIAAMRERGYDLTRHWSKGLADVPDLEFDVLVTFSCAADCSRVRARRREDWGVPAPKDMPVEQFRAIRDRIEEQVKELLAGRSVTPGLKGLEIAGYRGKVVK
jgi:protein-tyrosine-phosphatase